MKYTIVLPLLAAAATGFVIPDEALARQLALDPELSRDDSWWDSISSSLDDLRTTVEQTFSSTVDAFDSAAKSLSDSLPEFDIEFEEYFLPSGSWEKPGKRGHHGRPGHAHHPGLTNLTIYQAIKESNYTTKLAKLVDEFPEIVETLNSTEKNLTVFVPTDKAFEKIPEHHNKPAKEFIEKLLQYHVVPGLYPAGRVLFSHTLPTALKEDSLDGNSQRLRVSVGLFGVRINFYSRVIAVNIFANNGIIHAVDSILVPPPPAPKIIKLFPAKFSTFILAAETTSLGKELHGIKGTAGGTLFAPTNYAFEKLGPGANAFLFNTENGLGYLKALLKYHIVVNETLYSDAYYGKKEADAEDGGHHHIDLPTLLDDKSISVDISRWGGFITMKLNRYVRVGLQDVVAKDGVIQVVNNVLIPPHKHRGDYVEGEDIEVEELIERLEPYVEKGKDWSVAEL